MTVLVMRTSASAAESVKLDDLEPHALPLERADAHGMDVRRVPLAVAIDFILDLEDHITQPKKTSMPRYDSDIGAGATLPSFPRVVCSDPHAWVAAIMESATRKDSDYPEDMLQSIVRTELTLLVLHVSSISSMRNGRATTRQGTTQHLEASASLPRQFLRFILSFSCSLRMYPRFGSK
jgi:hypothetical protein